jgi:hypothetical protein
MWDWAIWAALILVTVAGIAALTLLLLNSLKTWRAVKEARDAFVGRLDGFTARAEAVADRIAVVDEGTAELQESLGRLRVSLARLAVLRAAIDEVDHSVARVAAVFPRK